MLRVNAINERNHLHLYLYYERLNGHLSDWTDVNSRVPQGIPF